MPVPASAGAPRCFLCSQGEPRIVSEFPVAALLRSWAHFGVKFSSGALGCLRGATKLELLECRGCGFRFFDPELAGTGEFYGELQKQIGSYYAEQRPEFCWVLKNARLDSGKVFDIGCGGGAFLDLARSTGLETYGMELNGAAAEVATKSGHTVFRTASIPPELNGNFDLLTAFQVVEHLPDPVGLLRNYMSLLRPGGLLAITVPHEKGVARICPWDPHQWPPHHLSRWRVGDLIELGRRCGIVAEKTGADPLVGGELFHFWKLHNALAAETGKPPLPGKSWLPWIVSFVIRKTGAKHFLRSGPSIYCLYRNQPPR